MLVIAKPSCALKVLPILWMDLASEVFGKGSDCFHLNNPESSLPGFGDNGYIPLKIDHNKTICVESGKADERGGGEGGRGVKVRSTSIAVLS